MVTLENLNGKRTIKNISNSGRQITLGDNSHWEILSTYDTFTSRFWMNNDEVVVKPSGLSKATFIKMALSGKVESVEATLVDKNH